MATPQRRTGKLWLLFALLMVPAQRPSYGQERPAAAPQLQPEHWFPLTLGSTWHYVNRRVDGIAEQWINRVTGDTVVQGHTWFKVQTIWNGEHQPTQFSEDIWYRVTTDHYVTYVKNRVNGLSGFDAGKVDTLIKSEPYSILKARNWSDTDDLTICGAPPEYSFYYVTDDYSNSNDIMTHSVNEHGSKSDSTNYALLINRYEGAELNTLCSWSFIYNIGLATNLFGAVVGGIEWGNTSTIKTLVARAPDEQPSAPELAITASYPNPVGDHLTLAVSTNAALGRVEAYDMLGRLLMQQEVSGASGPQTVTLDVSALPTGFYLARLVTAGGESRARPFVVQR